MKQKIYLPILVFLILICCLSCKKSATRSPSSSMTVRYEVSWTSTLDASVSSPENQLSYLNSTGNAQFDNLSGNSYTKTVTISSSENVGIIMAEALIELQQPGTGEIKIYVNNVLKADQTASSTQSVDLNNQIAYLLVLMVHWNVQ
jgi:hypothetical protein